MSTTASNTDINLSPHATGTIKVPSGYEDRSRIYNDIISKQSLYVDQVAQGLTLNHLVELLQLLTYHNLFKW